MCMKAKKEKKVLKNVLWTNKNKTIAWVKTTDEQVIPSCGAILSHFRSKWRDLSATCWGFSSQNKGQKMRLASFDLFDLCHPFDLSPLYFLLSTSHPSSASALWDKTPSIWRWRTSHMHSKTSSIRETTVLYLLWVQNTSVYLFCFYACEHLFTFSCTRVFILCYVLHPSELGWRTKVRDSCEDQSDISGIELRPTSLKHTCMQMSTHSRAGEARMSYKGVNYFSSFKNTQILIGKRNSDK